MFSAVKELCKIKEQTKSKTTYQIVKKLLEAYSVGQFLSQKELAETCFVSEALITKLAKKVNLAGYRELVVRLKIEYEANHVDTQPTINTPASFDANETWADIVQLHRFVAKNTTILTTIANDIYAGKNIAVISSGQSSEACRVFVDNIKIKGFSNINLINVYAFGRSTAFSDSLFAYDRYFFIFTGMINQMGLELYEECLQRIAPTHIYSLITKDKNMVKLPTQNINLDLDVKYSDVVYRNILFDFIFLEIINILNKRLSIF